jgi:glycosyltransferase involved in cell wall biosynthesis
MSSACARPWRICVPPDNAVLSKGPAIERPGRLRVGVRAQGFLDWTGGTAFLCGVMKGLQDGLPEAEVYLLLADRGPKAAVIQTMTSLANMWNTLRGAAPRGVAPENVETAEAAATRVEHLDLGVPSLARTARRLGLDIIIPSIGPLPATFEPPWVGYIYDFQHRQLPDLFSPKEQRIRDGFFAEISRNSHGIIVNSRDTGRIAAELYSGSKDKIHAMPFCACPDEAWFQATEVDPPCGRHVPYFMISNQFWIHKDHETAFRALALLPPRHRDVAIVCTGHTMDYRRPQHFNDLMMLVESLGLSNRVHIMGLLPKKTQIALMRRSVAVVQPTLCEGGPGGGATYDAVGLGVPAILSDIPINLELSDEREVSFFHARSPEDLAAAMTRLLDDPPLRDSPDVLIARGHARWHRYCAALRCAVVQTIAAGRAGS